MAYEPRGKVATLLEAMRQQPERIWTSPEVAEVMNTHQGALTAHLDAPIRHGALHRRLVNGRCQYSLKPFPVEPVSAPAQAGPKWTASAPEVPAGKREAFRERSRTDIAADMEPRGQRANRALVDKLQERMPHWEPNAPAGNAREQLQVTPPPTPSPEAKSERELNLLHACAVADVVREGVSPTVAQPPQPVSWSQVPQVLQHPEETTSDEPQQPAEDAEEDGPDAFLSCRTGAIVLVGLTPDEEGRVTIPPDLVEMIRRRTTWGPPA